MTIKFNNEPELSHFFLPIISKILKEDINIKDNVDSQFKNIFVELKYYYYKYDQVLNHQDPKLRKEFLLEPLMQIMKYVHDSVINKRFLKPTLLFCNEKDFGFMHINQILQYVMDYEIDWNIKGSDMYTHYKNTSFGDDLRKDPRIRLINSYTHSNKDYIQLIKDIEKNNKATSNVLFYEGISIDTAFKKWNEYVLTEYSRNNLSSHKKVAFFVGTMVGEAKKIKDDEFEFGSIDATSVDMAEYKIFFDEYGCKIDSKFKYELTGICDTLLDTEVRRKFGHWNTNGPLSRLVHKVNEKVLGPNWSMSPDIHYFDPTSATRNLTRDLKFNKLTCTELIQSNIDMADSRNYNPEAKRGQYDILNDDVKIYPSISNDIVSQDKYIVEQEVEKKLEKIDERLIRALKDNTPIFFLENPPHLSPNDEVDPGAVYNKIHENMKTSRTSWDKAQSQLCTQMLYRKILMKKKYNHTNMILGQILPTVWLKSPSFYQFRKLFFKHFRLEYGVIFKSNDGFPDLDSDIPMCYGVWVSGEETNKNKLPFHPIKRIYNKNGEEYEYEIEEDKIIYQENLDDKQTFVTWANPKHYKARKGMGQNIKISGPEYPISFDGSDYELPLLGCMRYDQEHENYILSAQINSGKIITDKNFERIIPYFAKFVLIDRPWYDIHTPLAIPDFTSDLYKAVCVNSVVFSTLTTSISKQSSFTILKGATGCIHNEFFFMNKDEVLIDNNIELDQNFVNSINKKENDRYVYTYLKKNKKYLLPEAQELIDFCKEITVKSLPRRKNIGTSSRNTIILIYFLNWDAGWFHIKDLLNKKEIEEYNKLHESFVKVFLEILKQI